MLWGYRLQISNEGVRGRDLDVGVGTNSLSLRLWFRVLQCGCRGNGFRE